MAAPRALPPWLQAADSEKRNFFSTLLSHGGDPNSDYGSTQSEGTAEEYDDDEEGLGSVTLDSDESISTGSETFIHDDSPGFIRVIVEWSELTPIIMSNRHAAGNPECQVLHGSNLRLLSLFLDEAPTPQQPPTIDTRRSSGGLLPGFIGSPQNRTGLATSPRPVIEVKTTTRPPTDNKVVFYNESFEFERAQQQQQQRQEEEVELEQEQRDKEEMRLLKKVEESGQEGQLDLLSSPDPSNILPPLTLDVLDADALLLLRIVNTEDGAVLAQTLIVVQNMRTIACPDDKDSVWATHALHSKSSGRCVGALRVGLRFRLLDSPDHLGVTVKDDDKRRHYYESELMSDAIFSKYDTNSDGYLTRKEFLAFISELSNVGGNIKQLEDVDDGSRCLGAIVPLPTMDLFSFIKHNHTLLVVCFDRHRSLRKHVSSSIWGRLGLVLMSLLWSLSVNCLVVIYMPSSERFWQILTITAVDNVGKSVLNGIFLLTHLRCWSRLARKCMASSQFSFLEEQRSSSRNLYYAASAGSSGCELASLLTFIIFLVFFCSWLLLTMSTDQLYSSGTSFFPIWCLSRFTEIFYWGTFWAFRVQYGSSESARKARQGRFHREQEREHERTRRARLLQQGPSSWWSARLPWSR